MKEVRMDLEKYLAEEEQGAMLRQSIDKEQIAHLKGKTIVIKYGGNAMKDPELKEGVMKDIALLRGIGARPVVVHGGGPFIQQLLDEVDLKSEFIGGHRKTTQEAMKYVEMALKGEVNGGLVSDLLHWGVPSVGLSGKDGGMVTATHRIYETEEDGQKQKVDLGRVGDIEKVTPTLLHHLLEKNYVPVLAPITIGPDLKSMNVNADMFAGHIAGALKAEAFVVLTDVDGLMEDKDDPTTLIQNLELKNADSLYGKTIQGGMIPKVDSCRIAIEKGVHSARIINGTTPNSIVKELISERRSGTRIE